MKITNTSGNRTNKIRGSRISIYLNNGDLIDRFVVPCMLMSAEQYCKKHPGGTYGKRYIRAIEQAQGLEEE